MKDRIKNKWEEFWCFARGVEVVVEIASFIIVPVALGLIMHDMVDPRTMSNWSVWVVWASLVIFLARAGAAARERVMQLGKAEVKKG